MNLETDVHIISFSKKGMALMADLSSLIKSHTAAPTVNNYDTSAVRDAGGLTELCRTIFIKHQQSPVCLIFISATGIAVRGIAPYIKDKLSDPPVIVIDDYGKYIISLLSGHIGSANTIALGLSEMLKKNGYLAEPVVTTATDIRGIQGFESVFDYYRIPLANIRKDIKTLNMAIANGEKIGVMLDPWLTKSFDFDNDAIVVYSSLKALLAHIGPRVVITIRHLNTWIEIEEESIKTACHVYISKSVVMGTGCRKALDYETYKASFDDAINGYGIEADAIDTLTSIGLKSNEICIHQLAASLDAKLAFYETDTLIHYEPYFEGSEFVKKTTGVSAVAGPSAYHLTKDEMSFKIIKGNKCTFSFGRLTL